MKEKIKSLFEQGLTPEEIAEKTWRRDVCH